MALQLSNNYAQRSLPASTYGENSTSNTVCVVIRTPASPSNGGIYTLYNSASNRYFGVRIATGNLEAGIRSSSGVPISLGAVAANTVYRITVTKTTGGSVSVRVNGGTAVTGTVAVATLGYTNIGVGTYFNSSMISTSNVEVAYARAYNRILTTAELDAFHAGNIAGIDNTGIIDAHDLISDLNTDASGTNLTFVDPESDPPVFTSWDPFAGSAEILSVNGGEALTPGETATWIVSGFAPQPNAGTLDGIALSGVSSSGFTVPGYVDGQKIPLPGTKTLVASNGAQSDSESVAVGVIPGYTYVVLAPGFDEGNYSVVQGAGASAGWLVIHPTTDVVGTNALLQSNAEGERTYWLADPVSGNGYSYLVTTGADGSLTVSRSLTSVGITGSGITGRGITGIGI